MPAVDACGGGALDAILIFAKLAWNFIFLMELEYNPKL
jgi:hypothetical protein